MASIYTHYRFGRCCAEEHAIFKRVKDKELFYFGQQGPDLFFFHLKLKIEGENPGERIHRKPCREYIERNRGYVKDLSQDSEEFAYFLGSICHFVLDAHVHPLVDQIETKSYSHMDIESELDRYYMEKDGLDPRKFKLKSLLPSWRKAPQILPLYRDYGVSELDVAKSIEDFKKFKGLFHVGNSAKEKILMKGLKLVGKEEYSGQMIHLIPFKESGESNLILRKAFEKAFANVPGLIKNLLDYIYGEGELSTFFDKNYNGRT